MRRLILALAAFCCAAGIHAQQAMQPGLWEMTSEMKMPGMPMPVHKWSHCLSAKDLAAGKQHSVDDGHSKCQMSDLKVSGATYSYGFACTSAEGSMSGKATGSSSSSSFRTDIKLKMTPDPGMGEINQLVTGRRSADCK